MVEFRVEAAPQPRSIAAWLQAWTTVANAPDVAFLLPREPLHPLAMVLLGAMAASRRQRGLASHPAGDPAFNPMAQLLIRSPASTDGGSLQGSLEKLRPIGDERAARDMAERVREALTLVTPPVPSSIVRYASFVFEELGVNIVQHSSHPETGYGLAAFDPSRRRLELAFADAGVGFRASLQRNPELEGRISDDAEALQLALTPHITGTSNPRANMGSGLKTLTSFSDLVAGELWIASGSALLQRRTTAGQRTSVVSAIPPWQGSWIYLEAAVT